ncbi:MAG: O-antigen ligase family protein [Planctomycetota bacterium]
MNRLVLGRTVHVIAVIVLMLIICARIAVLFVPQLWFDVDPAFDIEPLAGMNMAESLWLDVVLLIAAGIVLTLEGTLGRGLDLRLWLLAALPVPIVIWHGANDGLDLWRGMSWTSAAFAAVAVAHVARADFWRPVLIALLLGALLLPMARGVLQLTVEHDRTVAQFEAHRDEFFASRGWDPESSSALIYERRLRQAQPRGWFSTTNVLGSLLALCAVAGIGLSYAAERAKVSSGELGLLILMALAALGLLYFTGSKGAWLAMLVGFAWLTARYVAWAAPLRARGGTIVIAVLLLTLIGVVVRGTVLPEQFAGDKSLLFRWHYLNGTASMIADAPIAGVGPDDFQRAYIENRPPRSPEDPASAHNMIADWWASLGALGLAWVALVIIWLVQANRQDEDGEPDAAMPVRLRWWIAVLVLGGAGSISIIVDMRAAIEVVDIIVRQVAVGSAMVIAALLTPTIAKAWTNGGRYALGAGLLALVVHGLIEMTFFTHGAVAWALAMLAVTGRARDHGVRGVAAIAMGAAVVVLALYVVWTGARHATAQHRMIADAARMLTPNAVEQQTPDGPVQAFEPIVDAALLTARRDSSALLSDAYNAWPVYVEPLNDSARQLRLVTAPPDGTTPVGLLFDAAEISERAWTDHGDVASLMLLISIELQMAQQLEDPEFLRRAVGRMDVASSIDINGVDIFVRLGDFRWDLGEFDAAVAAYTTALTNNDNFELDELKQMPASARARLEHRIRQVSRGNTP